MKCLSSISRLETHFCGWLSILLLSVWCAGCGGGDVVEQTTFAKLKKLPATLTGELTITAFSESTPALGTLAIDGDSVFVIADIETLSHAGIPLAFGQEYRAVHTVTLEAAKSSDPKIPRYRITEIQTPDSD